MGRSRGARKKLHVPSIREVVTAEFGNMKEEGGIPFFHIKAFLKYIGPKYRQRAFENGHYKSKYSTRHRELKIDENRLQTIAVATLRSLGFTKVKYSRVQTRVGRYGHRFKTQQAMWCFPGKELPPSAFAKYSAAMNGITSRGKVNKK